MKPLWFWEIIRGRLDLIFDKIQMCLSSVLVCQGCHTKVPQTECVKQKKCIFPQFWGPEVQIKETAGLISLKPFSLVCIADGHLLPVSSHVLCSALYTHPHPSQTVVLKWFEFGEGGERNTEKGRKLPFLQ